MARRRSPQQGVVGAGPLLKAGDTSIVETDELGRDELAHTHTRWGLEDLRRRG